MKKLIGYIALSILAFLFAYHGIAAIMLSPSFIFLAMSIGIPFTLAKILVFVVGIVDILVAMALFGFRKPWLLIYAGIWPIVPVVLNAFSSGLISWMDLLVAPLMAFVAYKTLLKPKNK